MTAALTAEELAAMEAEADAVYPVQGWSNEEAASRAFPVVTEHVPALLAEVRRLTAALDVERALRKASDAIALENTRESMAAGRRDFAVIEDLTAALAVARRDGREACAKALDARADATESALEEEGDAIERETYLVADAKVGEARACAAVIRALPVTGSAT